MKSFVATILAVAVVCMLQPSGVESTTQVTNAVGTCSSTQFFDITSLQCRSCPTNKQPVPTTTGFTFLYNDNCECADGYIITSTDQSSCTQCTNQAPSLDNTVCMTCSGTDASYDANTLECACANSKVIVERDLVGGFQDDGAGTYIKTCVSCPTNSVYSSSLPYQCTFCNHWQMVGTTGTCVCPTTMTQTPTLNGTDTCLTTTAATTVTNSYPVAGAIVVEYDDGVSVSLNSDTFERSFLDNGVGCQANTNVRACNALGNLCVLQHQKSTTSACGLFTTIATSQTSLINGVSGWFQNMPFLEYTGDRTSITTQTNVNLQVGFDKPLVSVSSGVTTKLTFTLAKYHLNGTMLGFESLLAQTQLCPGLDEDLDDFLTVGYSYDNECQVAMANFTSGDPWYFYDMYLNDGDSLYPVPVVNKQYESSSGVEVNINSNPPLASELTNDVMTRRFFMIDNWSGKESYTADPTVIRVLTSMDLIITVQTDNQENIYPPYIQAQYQDFTTAGISSSTTQRVRFSVRYTMDTFNFWITMLVFLVLIIAITWVITFVRMWKWIKRSQALGIEPTVFVKGMYTLLHTTADGFFWLIFIGAVFWALFFKLQSTVVVLLPQEGDLIPYYVFIAVTVFLKHIHMLGIIVEQCRVDVFFLDWETPRGIRPHKEGQENAKVPVSFWRTMFIANEYNRMQSRRLVNVEYTYIVFLFLMEGVNLMNLASSQPDITNLSDNVRNDLLEFSVICLIWMCINVWQRFWNWIFFNRFIKNDRGLFVDVLSIANISTIILLDRYHGYYLHGRSVHPHADVEPGELHSFLRAEAEDKVPKRGLLPGTNMQTFHVYLDKNVRAEYDRVFMHKALAELSERRAVYNRFNNLFGQKTSGTYMISDSLISAYHAVNKIWFKYIDEIQTQHADYVVEKSYIQKTFGTAPDRTLLNERSLFFKDGTRSFQKVFFYGVEYDIMVWEILTLVAWQLATNNIVAATLITYFEWRILKALRTYFGTRNVAKKSLIDKRFLL